MKREVGKDMFWLCFGFVLVLFLYIAKELKREETRKKKSCFYFCFLLKEWKVGELLKWCLFRFVFVLFCFRFSFKRKEKEKRREFHILVFLVLERKREKVKRREERKKKRIGFSENATKVLSTVKPRFNSPEGIGKFVL